MSESEKLDMQRILQEFGDCTLRDLVLKYVDREIDRLTKASQDTLQQFSQDLMKQ